ncbi:TRAP-type mannitol/chloroaromatic compound transport system substrate-binding protein [Natronocella acetinitrilica]|uniref:TRAP-type mannitol/chloroaromatic compound transport system substrate-binding protein n=1 Tax=Natronocella acetinitrilica TaxID=414046 RepID=A0AAE3G613_9GAMM|nr:TRAP transporter substrate-binding protein DctP [Natronocella acetinitrilica]MCP1675371.1 TRAP-type mannitol/chloroaromatic compound transport system substrate-binding protein [Natronocella acetinitrilica]
MKRRRFLTGAGAGATVAASTVFSPHVFAQNRRFRLEMVTSWPEALTNLYGTAQYFAKRIEEMTDGDVTVRTYPAGAQVSPFEVYDAVSNGAFECCHTAPYYFIGKTPAHGFYTAIPFGLTLPEQDSWMIAGNGQALWDELNARDNMIAYPGGNTGAQTGGWFNKEINSPDDLRGLRMRFPGHGGRVMAAAGVNIQQLPGGEVFTAMERGVLDAAEWVGPFDDQILGMHRVARYYYMPSWAEPSAMLGFYFNLDVWGDMPDDIKHQIRACCYESNAWMSAQYQAKNPVALTELVEEHGIEVKDFPESVMDAFREGARVVHEEDMEASSMYRTIYEDWAQHRDIVRGWNARTTHAYERFLYDHS